MANYMNGVTPSAVMEENEKGGKQSKVEYAFELLPPSALFAAAAVAKQGAEKYGESFGNRNYTKIPSTSHINHAIGHLYAHLSGDHSDDHLAHAIVRLLFAFDCYQNETTDTTINNLYSLISTTAK